MAGVWLVRAARIVGCTLGVLVALGAAPPPAYSQSQHGDPLDGRPRPTNAVARFPDAPGSSATDDPGITSDQDVPAVTPDGHSRFERSHGLTPAAQAGTMGGDHSRVERSRGLLSATDQPGPASGDYARFERVHGLTPSGATGPGSVDGETPLSASAGPSPSNRPRVTLSSLGLAGLGLGAIGLSTGLVTGVAASNRLSDYRALCPADACFEDSRVLAQDLLHRYRTLRATSLTGVVVGVLGVTSGVVLIRAARRRGRAAVSIGASEVSLHGQF